ncbi:hypothetical protein [Paracraurococcus ruber]|uniref:Phage protein n=1 Tax=Paracraurococcus ruber TaxID=77675 RepID=A0ABS1CUP9_9PROT|nr:hypothetical protein [Paracraurococcus ruber]MBK1658055.1 hypothetical protein [Paracraurococcus ruber]TDG34204.1 hypothetical protein E2C05_00145 [Paracraurococcus ruber]
MAQSRILKTSFTAGELAPELLGRPDLRAYANGARTLRNVVIQPTGGVTRRPGLRHVATLPGAARLIAFEFNTEQTYLLALTAGALRVFVGDSQVAQVAGPWTAAMLPQLAFTQSADTLLLCHPDMVPQKVTRTSNTAWTVAPWSFLREPFYRFADAAVTLTPSATVGTVTLTASAAVFQAGHAGVRFRIGGKRVLVTAVASATQATATVEEALAGTAATTDWEEAALSPVHGWPVTLCFHQDRLVLGGSRDLPNRLWLSRSGDLFNFDLGTGLDDQAIEFGLVSDQVNAIRGVFSGQHLQVFTSGAEWMVTGTPLTPGSIQLNRQTRVGSPVARLVQPVDVDGSTIFAARSGRGIFEFTYTDLQQLYQANDLALVSQHLVRDPVAMTYDQRRRLLHVAMADGSLATLTLYRAEQVTAWCGQETDGAVRSLADIEGAVYAVVERRGTPRLERFDDGLALDAALTGSAATPQDTWAGLGHLAGETVGVLADGAPRASAVVANGAVTIDPPASSVQIGLPFTHRVEPLPADLTSAIGTRAAPIRLVAITFRLLETQTLSVDLGRGSQPVSFRRLDTAVLDAAPPAFTGDVTLRAVGWRRDALAPLWRIEDDTPLPMTLLSVTMDMRMTD